MNLPIILAAQAQDAAGIFLLLIVAFIYFLPAFIGRKKRNSNAILMLNLFLGWTFIGWVVALVWATTRDPEA